jgi:hypothetical protein
VLSDVINRILRGADLPRILANIMMELELALPGDRFLPWRFEEGL